MNLTDRLKRIMVIQHGRSNARPLDRRVYGMYHRARKHYKRYLAAARSGDRVAMYNNLRLYTRYADMLMERGVGLLVYPYARRLLLA